MQLNNWAMDDCHDNDHRRNDDIAECFSGRHAKTRLLPIVQVCRLRVSSQQGGMQEIDDL